MDQPQQLPPPKERIELRVELKFETVKTGHFSVTKKSSSRNVIQGQPYKTYLVITNMSNKAFKGASLTNIVFRYLGNQVTQTVNHDVQVPAMNPKGSLEVEVTACTFDLDGGGWLNVNVEPESSDQEIQCYQYDLAHEKDEPVSGLNYWGISFFIEGKLATLQTKTNNYILGLTVITVIEAVFGIKNTLLFLATNLAVLFGLLAELFSWLASLT